MSKKPKILVAGILDTKGNEIKFIAERVKAAGGDATIFELTVGKEVGWADINLSEVLANTGITLEEFMKLAKTDRVEAIVKGAINLVGKLWQQGKVDGIISTGGSMGSSIVSRIMQTLPVGLPKIMCSTMASGDVRPYVGTKDICMLYPIAEVGLNVVTRKILNNAAGAIVGMCTAPIPEGYAEKKLIGCMMFGVTTPAVLRASKYFEDRDYDVMINHAVGSGGKSMEELITDGYIVGMLDITTHEIADFLLGGVLSAGPDRLTAAGNKGIPQVVAPGGLDVINFGPEDTVPEHYRNEMNTPGRAIKVHNPMVTIVGTSIDEAYQIGVHIAKKLNNAKGPTVLCVPLMGWGAYDTKGNFPELGWSEDIPAPCWISDPDNPKRSWRATYFVKALRENINRSKANLDVILVDCHMNENRFADMMAELLEEMLLNKWKKGSHHDKSDVVDF
jgi:uncharacterized protein (UPF0261 family)